MHTVNIQGLEVTRWDELIGKTILKIARKDNEQLLFMFASGDVWTMYHSKDCCESVEIDDISGYLDDLKRWPLTMAEQVTYDNVMPDGITKKCDDSYTWTFYKFATVKGTVTIKWLGQSNGYYSESVTFGKMEHNPDRALEYFDSYEVLDPPIDRAGK